MKTIHYLTALSGENAPDALALFIFTPDQLVNLRSARKLVLDHDLESINIKPANFNPCVLVETESNGVDVLAGKTLCGFDHLELSPEEAQAFSPYLDGDIEGDDEGDDKNPTGAFPCGVVVTARHLWVEYAWMDHDDDEDGEFETLLVDLASLLGPPDENNY